MSVIEATVAQPTATTRWQPVASVLVGGDVGHPQGLTRWGEHWLVSTVFPDEARGALLVVDDRGGVLDGCAVGDGDRFHPGGIDARTECFVPVAEYRPHSTTTVYRIDENLRAAVAFRFHDHLGALCAVDGGMLFAVSWGSREFYLLDRHGRIVKRAPNPSNVIDFQDLQYLGDGLVLTSGFGELNGPAGRMQIGGMALIRVPELALARETPIGAWMPSGRAATYNAAHFETSARGGLELHCLADDTVAALTTWASD